MGAREKLNALLNDREHKHAYVEVETEPGKWSVVICEENLHGYRVVPDYGPYKDETRAEGVAQRLNARLGISINRAREIVRSTMPSRAHKNMTSTGD